MRAVDTNVLIRLLARDDQKQMEAAEAFVATGAWISHVVLAEAIWVLSSVYGLGAREISTAVEMLLKHQNLALQDHDAVTAALAHYRSRPSVEFSDYLVLEIARRAGHLPLGTFHRSLAKTDGAEKL